ncbi:DUF6064 family protein [Magnetospira sp. QH-2]|uniref:DUF6064 family protein n=1 Tax=Magnetospira sp. (strain QH-2) TaxID=1288970 RepID=UPI0003E816E8|nr:DUF6064 family protein [Magnetospira sp. QH-2]CCQ73431.1 Membrane protein of unknown function [Magnetospira sp. QH-2]
MVPYTVEVLVSLFGRYNETLWPAGVVAPIIAVLLTGLLYKGGLRGLRMMLVGLAVGWAVTGGAFHWLWMSELSWGGVWIGALFLVQSAILLWVAVTLSARSTAPVHTWQSVAGWIVILLGALGYSLAAAWGPFGWAAMPIVGVAPLPTTLLTFGVLVLHSPRLGVIPGVLPSLWAVFTAMEAWSLPLYPDLLLPAGALLWGGVILGGQIIPALKRPTQSAQ